MTMNVTVVIPCHITIIVMTLLCSFFVKFKIKKKKEIEESE